MPYIGEIRMFAGTFAPLGWEFCAGQLIPISENDALYTLIGTSYGGDGESTFALPDLRGRLPLHQGLGFTLASAAGQEEVTLSTSQMPIHSHALLYSGGTATALSPAGALPSNAQGPTYFNLPDNPVTLAASSIGPTGGSQPHTNMQPYLCVNFIISLYGIFPTPS